ncbi:efflux transporter outer membrane subunit [Rhodanobacter sp. Root561]|uniref:efflux transporter outer membrane subunit n=1 Tax=Rhodanobacter sp. Root561 TaxID=1736560 RepID=UPI001F442607|nr:efflux transporter outer membrane subunit [Rhodanobacter sp. Root561]
MVRALAGAVEVTAAMLGRVRSPGRLLVAAVAALAIGGCAVGPDFHRPSAPEMASVAAGPMPASTASANVAGGRAQHFVAGADIPAQWWTLFHSTALNALVEQALAHNADLKAAQAALDVARETTLAGRGARYPSVTAGMSASREQDPPGALAPVPSNNAFLYNLFTPQVSVSYVPDVFGLNRRTQESLQAQQQAVRFQMLATRITLSTNVVAAAVQQASLRAQVAATRELVGINAHMVQILQYQRDKGYAGGLELAAQQAQLAQVKASLPPLLTQLEQQNHLLAVLAGQLPEQASSPSFDLAALQLPQALPLSLPSTLVAQRPDVRQAEANMHAASAQIGVAIANRLPNISLSANAGSTALAINQLFKSGTGFWSVGADLAAPIFQGGSLLHQERAAKAAYAQAAEEYRGTVLTAFQNVADVLSALQHDAEGLQAAAGAEQAAKLTLDLSRRQYQAGYAGYLSLLSAEQGYQQARIALVQAQASRYADTAALFQALGGGWWHADDASSDQPRHNPGHR